VLGVNTGRGSGLAVSVIRQSNSKGWTVIRLVTSGSGLYGLLRFYHSDSKDRGDRATNSAGTIHDPKT
jgi:hypothetical protein